MAAEPESVCGAVQTSCATGTPASGDSAAEVNASGTSSFWFNRYRSVQEVARDALEKRKPLEGEDHRRACEIRHFLRVLAPDEWWSWLCSRPERYFNEALVIMVEAMEFKDITRYIHAAPFSLREQYRKALSDIWRTKSGKRV